MENEEKVNPMCVPEYIRKLLCESEGHVEPMDSPQYAAKSRQIDNHPKIKISLYTFILDFVPYIIQYHLNSMFTVGQWSHILSQKGLSPSFDLNRITIESDNSDMNKWMATYKFPDEIMCFPKVYAAFVSLNVEKNQFVYCILMDMNDSMNVVRQFSIENNQNKFVDIAYLSKKSPLSLFISTVKSKNAI